MSAAAGLPTRIFGERGFRTLDRSAMVVASALRSTRPEQPYDTGQTFRSHDAEQRFMAWAATVTAIAADLSFVRPHARTAWRARFCYFAGLDAFQPGGFFYGETGGTEQRLTEMEALRLGFYWPDGRDPLDRSPRGD